MLNLGYAGYSVEKELFLCAGMFATFTYDINFCVGMAHIAHNAPIPHLVHVFPRDDIFVAGSRDHNIDITNNFIKFDNSKTIHTENIKLDLHGFPCIYTVPCL